MLITNFVHVLAYLLFFLITNSEFSFRYHEKTPLFLSVSSSADDEVTNLRFCVYEIKSFSLNYVILSSAWNKPKYGVEKWSLFKFWENL